MPEIQINKKALEMLEKYSNLRGDKSLSQTIENMLLEIPDSSQKDAAFASLIDQSPSQPIDSKMLRSMRSEINEGNQILKAAYQEATAKTATQNSPVVIHPVKPDSRSSWVIATGYYATGNFYGGRKDYHTGWDYNLASGGDTDAGKDVVAVADGIVVFAGNVGSWGGIVVVQHPQFGWRSRYAHIEGFKVRSGQQVRVGQPLGVISKARVVNGKVIWYAHLHFDVTRQNLPPGHWCGADGQCVLRNYVDLLVWAQYYKLPLIRAVPAGNQLSFNPF